MHEDLHPSVCNPLHPFSAASGAEKLAAVTSMQPAMSLLETSPFLAPVTAVSHEGRGVLALLMTFMASGPLSANEMNDLLSSAMPSVPVGAPYNQQDWAHRRFIPAGLLDFNPRQKTFRANPKTLEIVPAIAFMFEQGESHDMSMLSVFGSPQNREGRRDPQATRIAALRYLFTHLPSGEDMTNEEARIAIGAKTKTNARNVFRTLANEGFFELDTNHISDDDVYKVADASYHPADNAGVVLLVAHDFMQTHDEFSRQELESFIRASIPADLLPQEEGLRKSIANVIYKLTKNQGLQKVSGSINDGQLIVDNFQFDMVEGLLEGFDKFARRDRAFLTTFGHIALDITHDTSRLTAAYERLRMTSGRAHNSEILSPKASVVAVMNEVLTQHGTVAMSSREITELVARAARESAKDRHVMRVLKHATVDAVLRVLEADGTLQVQRANRGALYELASESAISDDIRVPN